MFYALWLYLQQQTKSTDFHHKQNQFSLKRTQFTKNEKIITQNSKLQQRLWGPSIYRCDAQLMPKCESLIFVRNHHWTVRCFERRINLLRMLTRRRRTICTAESVRLGGKQPAGVHCITSSRTRFDDAFGRSGRGCIHVKASSPSSTLTLSRYRRRGECQEGRRDRHPEGNYSSQTASWGGLAMDPLTLHCQRMPPIAITQVIYIFRWQRTPLKRFGIRRIGSAMKMSSTSTSEAVTCAAIECRDCGWWYSG